MIANEPESDDEYCEDVIEEKMFRAVSSQQIHILFGQDEKVTIGQSSAYVQ